jgi:hypothetical protein
MVGGDNYTRTAINQSLKGMEGKKVSKLVIIVRTETAKDGELVCTIKISTGTECHNLYPSPNIIL